MKAFFLLCSLLVFASASFAQEFSKNSTVIIENQRLYTLPSKENLEIKGQIDAERNYRKYKAAAVGTLITSLFSPLVGLVPAIICSASTPKLENLGYPDEELFRQPIYNQAYVKKAKKIKKGKVWKNWGIGLGVNLAIAILVVAGN